MAHAVNRGVAQVDVGRAHVDLGAQHGGAVSQLAVFHIGKALQVLGHAAVAEGAVHAGACEVTTVGLHVFGRLLVHVGQALLNQVHGAAVHEVKVIAGEIQIAFAIGTFPVKAQPLNGILDAVHVFLVFFFGVGVVKTQVAHAAIVFGQAEVQANGLGMAHVQVAVGLGREACANLGLVHLALLVVLRISRRAAPMATCVGALVQVGFNDLAQEVGGFHHFRIFVVGVGGCAHIPLIVGRLARKGRHCGCCNLCHSIQAFTLCLPSRAYPQTLEQQVQR